jgi:hypothetical protein
MPRKWPLTAIYTKHKKDDWLIWGQEKFPSICKVNFISLSSHMTLSGIWLPGLHIQYHSHHQHVFVDIFDSSGVRAKNKLFSNQGSTEWDRIGIFRIGRYFEKTLRSYFTESYRKDFLSDLIKMFKNRGRSYNS